VHYRTTKISGWHVWLDWSGQHDRAGVVGTSLMSCVSLLWKLFRETVILCWNKIWLMLTLFLILCALLVDQWCPRFNVQLDLLRAPHRVGFVFHAQSSAWCPQWVSCPNAFSTASIFPPVLMDSTNNWNLFPSWISSVVTLSDAREFSNERGRVERRAEFHKIRSRKMFTAAMSAYFSWITQAGFAQCLHKSRLIIAQ
jgi:hypothetical protein